MSPVACSACAWSRAEHRTLLLLPSLSPVSLLQRCRQARLCVSLFQCFLFRVPNCHLNLEPAELFANEAYQAFHREASPSCQICQHRRESHCAEALHSSPHLGLIPSFSPSLGHWCQPWRGAWCCCVPGLTMPLQMPGTTCTSWAVLMRHTPPPLLLIAHPNSNSLKTCCMDKSTPRPFTPKRCS